MKFPKLIAEWKQAYKFLSVHVSLVSSSVLVAWLATPKETQEAILSTVGLNTPAAVALFGFAAVILSRVIAQEPKK